MLCILYDTQYTIFIVLQFKEIIAKANQCNIIDSSFIKRIHDMHEYRVIKNFDNYWAYRKNSIEIWSHLYCFWNCRETLSTHFFIVKLHNVTLILLLLIVSTLWLFFSLWMIEKTCIKINFVKTKKLCVISNKFEG